MGGKILFVLLTLVVLTVVHSGNNGGKGKQKMPRYAVAMATTKPLMSFC